MQHCCMFVSFHFFRIHYFLIISASFDPRTIHTHARTRLHSLLLLSFLSNGCVCVCRVIYFFLSLFRNWPSDLLLSLFLPTLVYNAVLSSSSSVCHCDLFLLYSFSLTLMFLFWRSFALSCFHALSLTQSKLVLSLPLLQHITRVASNKKASNL